MGSTHASLTASSSSRRLPQDASIHRIKPRIKLQLPVLYCQANFVALPPAVVPRAKPGVPLQLQQYAVQRRGYPRHHGQHLVQPLMPRSRRHRVVDCVPQEKPCPGARARSMHHQIVLCLFWCLNNRNASFSLLSSYSSLSLTHLSS